MFEAALSSNNANSKNMNESDIKNNDNGDNKESENANIKNENYTEIKTENMSLQRKIAMLEQENMRLKANNVANMNMPNTFDIGALNMDLTQNSIVSSAIGSMNSNTSNPNKRIRKQRDLNMSLMNPRRAKRRKTGFKFAGSKKK